MKKVIIIFCTLLTSAAGCPVFAQLFSASRSFVEFYSHSPVEDIKASNTKAAAVCNMDENTVAFSIPIADFQFDKALMKDHFNEKYMETEKFPKSTFAGILSSFKKEPGVQQVIASGKLSIHGVERDVVIPGTVEWKGDQLSMKSKFIVVLEDYKIIRPQILWQNIAEQVEITIDFTFNPKK
jgi:polyisoprenoid-binding protein YceI